MTTPRPAADLDLSACRAVTGLCDRTLRAKIASGDLAAFRVGRSLRVEPAELARFIEARRVPVVPSSPARSAG
jgi:excisionase family DNA binding protein